MTLTVRHFISAMISSLYHKSIYLTPAFQGPSYMHAIAIYGIEIPVYPEMAPDMF